LYSFSQNVTTEEILTQTKCIPLCRQEWRFKVWDLSTVAGRGNSERLKPVLWV
jgi:hypothetical protein